MYRYNAFLAEWARDNTAATTWPCSGHTTVGYCIMGHFVVAAPLWHRDLQIFRVTEAQLCCRKPKNLSRAQLWLRVHPLFTRSSPESRRAASETILARVSSPLPWPQVLVYPEGLIGNGTCLLRFNKASNQHVKPIGVFRISPDPNLFAGSGSDQIVRIRPKNVRDKKIRKKNQKYFL